MSSATPLSALSQSLARRFSADTVRCMAAA